LIGKSWSRVLEFPLGSRFSFFVASFSKIKIVDQDFGVPSPNFQNPEQKLSPCKNHPEPFWNDMELVKLAM